jgi:hypothetical protein
LPVTETDIGAGIQGGSPGLKKADLTSEIEDNRYFVVLMAFDSPMMWKKKKHKLLRETRFSILQIHHQLDRDLPAVALGAAL